MNIAFIQLFSAICTAVLSTPAISVATVVYGNIQGKILQWLVTPFCTGDIAVTPSQNFLPILVKSLSSEAQRLRTGWRLPDGHLAQVVCGGPFLFKGRVGKLDRLTSHTLASRLMPLTEV